MVKHDLNDLHVWNSPFYNMLLSEQSITVATDLNMHVC